MTSILVPWQIRLVRITLAALVISACGSSEREAAGGIAAELAEPSTTSISPSVVSETSSSTPGCLNNGSDCDDSAERLLESLGEYGLSKVPGGDFELVDDFTRGVGMYPPCVEPFAVEEERTRRQRIFGDGGLMVVERGIVIWDSSAEVDSYFARFPVKTGCTIRQWGQEWTLTSLETVNYLGWDGYAWSFTADDGSIGLSGTHLGKENKLAMSDSGPPEVARALTESVVEFLENGG